MQTLNSGKPRAGLGWTIQAGFVAALFLVWHLLTVNGFVRPLILPPVGAVLSALGRLVASGAFLPDLLVTLGEIAAAVGIAAALGLGLGFLCSKSGFRIKVFDPLFSSLYAVPSILFYPLFVMSFGIGMPSKIAMGALIAFFPIVMATMAGFSNVDRIWKTAALSMGASEKDLFFSVLLPASLPVIASGLRIGMITATGGTLAAEALASFDGLGHQIVNLADQFRSAEMYAYILLTMAMALTITLVAFAVEKKAMARSGEGRLT